MEEIVKQKPNNNKTKGFASHPENINRKGRPPLGHSLTDTLRELLSSKPELKMELIMAAIEAAKEKKDIGALKLLWSYLEGYPVATHEIHTDEISHLTDEELDQKIKELEAKKNENNS